jgi:histone acetyltransferase (RNA polymerase elongator complex component)
MPHRNIPIFIPHLGCPNQCVFCNQRSISGCREFEEREVAGQIEAALSTIPVGVDTEIAFFGGSFTGIDRDLMIRLLETAERYVTAGRVQSIRLSTRPDYISSEILGILARYTVRVIELGLQSMDDAVLRACQRGHTAEQAEYACRAVVDAGFGLVGQMMIGLPGADAASEIYTAERIVALGAEAARIYPTVVFYHTPLCEMTQRGDYTPLTVNEAVLRSASVLRVFEEARVPCIRIGLCATEELISPEAVLAGPNHPALGELVWNEYYYREIVALLQRKSLLGKDVILTAPKAEISKLVGQKRCNINRLLRETDTRVKKIVGEENRNGIAVTPWQASVSKQEEKQPCI